MRNVLKFITHFLLKYNGSYHGWNKCKCYSLSFVRSVEDGLAPSQTYDEVNKTSS